MKPGSVLKRYYALRQARSGQPEPRYFRKKAWKRAEDYLAWCAKAGIDDPLSFLEFRFRAGDYAGHVPMLHRLRSNKLAEKWKQFGQGQLLQEQQGRKLSKQAGSRFQQSVKSLRILTVGMEAAKRPYIERGETDLCMAEMEFTGGYHPSSRFCPTCPSAVACAAKLYQQHGFDVVSLRAGRLYAVPSEVAAAAVQ